MKKKNVRSELPGARKRPYNFFGDYLWNTYGARILKLPVDAGFTCPNRDGAIGSAGCIFCSEDGSASPTARGTTDVKEQMENARRSFRRSEAETRYIAYFQAFTNTYAPVSRLRELYDTALSVDGVMGLMIATRPDCVPDDVLDLVASYQGPGFELWLEIGMQTMHETGLALLGRGHTHQSTRDAVRRASERGIPVCAHIILGVPGESWDDMMATAVEVSSLPLKGVKIHHLHVIAGTELERLYREKGFRLPSLGEYVSAVCDFLERLRPDILVHRLLGDRSPATLVAPAWGLHKGTVLGAIDAEFGRRVTRQGFLWDGARPDESANGE
ncbi:MAG TPA: TIGR01212 family radical SAM protein [Spirochaetota bacterium]|nr:TIGR01212 family radical SAM protein [Spirochaetota bacterium]HPV97471.1 TIGR01212 family radical SAM protein [Spirochaetota bacterium]